MKAQTCGRDCLAKGAATVKSATETRITAKANRRSPGPAGQVDSKVAAGVMWRAISALDVRGMRSIRTCFWPIARRVKGSLHIWDGFGSGLQRWSHCEETMTAKQTVKDALLWPGPGIRDRQLLGGPPRTAGSR